MNPPVPAARRGAASAIGTIATIAAIAVVLAGGFFLTGCNDDENPGPPPCGELDAMPYPASEDQLLANFRTAYESMDFGSYRQLLDPDFVMYLQPSTRQEFPDVGPTLDLSEELVIAERMFSGQPITNSNGDLVAGISAVGFAAFEQQGGWATSAATDSIPDTRFALFAVVLQFDRPGDSTLSAVGLLKVYVTSRDTVVCGANRSYYRLRGLVDLTDGGLVKGGVEPTPFGTVKALFW